MAAMAATRHIPDDIQMEILSRCPVKSLLRFRSVCKLWRYWITQPKFVQLQLTHSHLQECLIIAPYAICKMEHARWNCYLEFVGTCNGLLFCSINNEELIVFNPSTKQYKELPLPPLLPQLEEGTFSCSWGFGYDKSTEDYKVVLGLEGRDFLEKIMVFSFQDNFWRIRHQFQFDEEVGISLTGGYNGRDSAVVNGRVHWIGRTFKGNKIVSFDLSDEGMNEILTSDQLQNFHDIGIVAGSLSVSEYLWDGVGGCTVNLWVMKQYDVKDSWMILYKILNLYPNDLISPILCLRNGEICVGLVHQNKSYNFLAYFPREGKQRAIEAPRIADAVENDHGRVVAAFKESLISPNCGRDWKGGNPQFINFMTANNNFVIFDVGSLVSRA